MNPIAANPMIGGARGTRLLAVAVALAAAVLVVALAGARDAGAQEGGGCGQGGGCVLLIEVDGLEPKDVTAETTPILWSLAHPSTSPVGLAIDANRRGWTWQAGRSVMSAGTLPATASLLTGGYAEQTGVPADEFMDQDGAKRRLGALETADGTPIGDASPMRNGDMTADMLTSLIEEQKEGNQAAAFIGNPALGPLIGELENQQNLFWTPTGENDQQNPPNPAYCPFLPPRSFDPLGDNPSGPFDSKSCIAQDIVTLNKAFNGLKDNGTKNSLAYIHLAELGVLKKLAGDTDRLPEPELFGVPTAGTGGNQQDQPTTVAGALALTDAAIATFLAQYIRDPGTGARWQDTVLFIVGSHGYELTPATHRVPHPADVTDSVENYIEEGIVTGNKLEFTAQGTMGTVYCTGCTDEERPDVIRRAKVEIETTIQTGCVSIYNLGPCIEEVLFVNPALSQTEDLSDTVNGAVPTGFQGCERDPDAPAGRHPSWRFDHRVAEKEKVKVKDPVSGVETEIEADVCKRSGASGDLIVMLKPTWAFGNVIPSVSDTLTNLGTEITNPYEASSGGPRNRAIATLVNGPSQVVRQVSESRAGGRSPVTKGKTSVEEAKNQRGEPAGDLTQVNANPEDDADDPGHEAQPITVDFAPTIAALLKISVPPEQLGGRILQEAFVPTLELPSDEEDLGEPLADLPPPPVEVIQYPPIGFDFTGLVRAVQAQVSDGDGNTVREVGRGRTLHHIKIEGDFGRPDSQLTLTFYEQRTGKGKRERRASSSSSCGTLVVDPVKDAVEEDGERRARVVARTTRRGSSCRLKTLAKFKPFTIGRGHVELRLKVPPRFQPTHVGVAVQEVERLPAFVVKRLRTACKRQQEQKPEAERQPCTVLKFVGSGPKGGGIMILRDAQHLHSGGKSKKKSSKKR